MYDTFSQDYDRFVNWPGRLAFELPFIESQLQALAAEPRDLHVMDAACGTGMHAIALAQRGFRLYGADISAGMVERARLNAAQARVTVPFETAGFGELTRTFGEDRFDALLCLGNSLPHLLSAAEIKNALKDFAACMRPGGLLLLQNRNFETVMAEQQRWMEPQSHRAGQDEWLFVRFYDFEPGGFIRFNILVLKRSGGESWQQQVITTTLRPLHKKELMDELGAAGFIRIESFGSLAGEAFDPKSSGNLVVVARKQK